MKILLIDVNCQNSSTGKIVYDLYQGLEHYGYKTAVCYGRGSIVKKPLIYKFGLDWETFLHAGLARLTGLNGCFSYFSTKRLLNFIEQFNPDIVHIHELHAYFINISLLLKYLKKKQIPIIWTFHCEYMYTGKCGHAYECDKWKTECGKCPHLKDYPKSLFIDFTKLMFHKKKHLLEDLEISIVTPSKWLADRVMESFLKNKKVCVIHNGIDAKNIFRVQKMDDLVKKHQLEGKKVVLSVAPNILEERKGGQFVLQVADKMKNDNIIFILVGTDVTKKYSENVWLIKRTNNQHELAKWYSLADLFLICSSRENFPTTCLEALCCGTPVCGFQTGGVKETAEEPYGHFIEYGNCDKLTKLIQYVLELNLPRKQIAEYGKKQYSISVMVEKYNELYLNQYNNE